MKKLTVPASILSLAIAATFLLLLCMPRQPAAADQPDPAPFTETTDIPAVDDENGFIDTTQQQASTIVLDAAEWFDSFFDDSRSVAEENISEAKLRIITKYHEEDGFDFSPSIRWRIHLPRLSKKAQLLFFAAKDEDLENKQSLSGTGSTEDNLQDDFAAVTQYFIKMSKKYNISTTFGGSFNYLYGGLRFRYYQDFGSWQGRFIERVRYYTDDGWENMASVDLERQFSQKWLFRTSGQVYWREWEDNISQTLTFQLYQFLSDKQALSYEWENTLGTEPSHELSDLRLQVRYRQQFYRDWLIFEITPNVNFPEEDDHDPKYGIIFILEAKFGHRNGKRLRNIFRF